MTTRKIVLIVGAIVVAVGLVVMIFVGGIIGFAFYSVGKSDAAMKAKDFLRTNPTLTQDIGEVKDFGTFVTGSINIQNENGAATLNLKVIGAHKTVNASVNLAYYRGRDWRVSSASYVNDHSETVNLLNPYEATLMFDTLQWFIADCRLPIDDWNSPRHAR
jgi:Cytochrome oxidase complex assembly protein 1